MSGQTKSRRDALGKFCFYLHLAILGFIVLGWTVAGAARADLLSRFPARHGAALEAQCATTAFSTIWKTGCAIAAGERPSATRKRALGCAP